jgi:hypothetical protein
MVAGPRNQIEKQNKGLPVMLAGRAAADDDEVVAAYVGNSDPACSAAMYSAYQSGQFGSAWPMRFS